MSTSKRYIPLDRPHSEWIEAAVEALKLTRKRVEELLEEEQEHVIITAPDGTPKDMLLADKIAEKVCAKFLIDRFPDGICVLGEESLWQLPQDLDLTKSHVERHGGEPTVVEGPETKITAIVDMVDGSDLVERNLGNWCSAMVFFQPGRNPKILFSLVQNADGTIYGADEKGTFLLKSESAKGSPLQELGGPETRKLRAQTIGKSVPQETAQIAICFYAQKYQHFATIPSGLPIWVKNSGAKQRLRIYNLAGNPMMVRLANGEHIHGVFEHVGQFPHDAVPGAYIGIRAGAELLDMAGNKITADDLAKALLKPSGSKIRYVLASSSELAVQLAGALRTNGTYYKCPGKPGQKCDAEKVLPSNSTPPHCDVCLIPMIEHDRRGSAAVA